MTRDIDEKVLPAVEIKNFSSPFFPLFYFAELSISWVMGVIAVMAYSKLQRENTCF